MWIVKGEYIDKRLGHHVVVLHEPESDAHHLVQIVLGHEHCPACGHVKAKTNTGQLDPQAIVKAELEELNKSHANIERYRQQHRVPLKK